MNEKLLAIYLNDHLAGSTAGLDLAKRTAGENKDNEFGSALSRLAKEIEDDRETLRDLMRTLGVGEDRVKVTVAWASEKVGRFKLNGQLLGYSPLSRLVEMEGLLVGVRGKKALWDSLLGIGPGDARLAVYDFAALSARAQSQLDEVEALRLRAAELAFAAA